MQKTLLLLCLLPLLTLSYAQTPGFSIMDAANRNGGTTTGEVVRPTTFDQQLNNYGTSASSYIVLNNWEFIAFNLIPSDLYAPVRKVPKLASNKTLLGVDSSGFLNQINIDVNSIILRNIKMNLQNCIPGIYFWSVYADKEITVVGKLINNFIESIRKK